MSTKQLDTKCSSKLPYKIDTCLTKNFKLVFNYSIVKSKCPIFVPIQRVLTWNIKNKNVLQLFFSIKDSKIAFFWNDQELINGMVEKKNKLTSNDFNQKNINNKLKYIPLLDSNTFELTFDNNKLNLKINNKLIADNLSTNFDKIIKDKTTHQFQVNSSQEIKINKLRIEPIISKGVIDTCPSNIIGQPRTGFNLIELPDIKTCPEKKLNCPPNKQIVEKVYLTPEIFYHVKKCETNKNLNKNKKNNVSNNYNNMSGKICISNPLVSFKGFTMEFIVKNLILFGLLYLFQTLLGNPAIETTPKLYVCAVVILIYNLLHIIFVILENIFVWACQYSSQIDELVSDEL